MPAIARHLIHIAYKAYCGMCGRQTEHDGFTCTVCGC